MRSTLRSRLLPSVPEELRSNFIHYYFDISWWGLYGGSTAAFLTIYATRLGASAFQIGLLTALPATISLALSLPAGRLVHRVSAWRATWVAAFISRLMFVLYAILPFFFHQEDQIKAILWVSVFISIPTTIIGVSFSQLLIEAVPGEWRGMVVGVRMALYSIITFFFTIISGQILSHTPFQTGYQIIFGIGFIGAVMTTYHLWSIRPLEKNYPALFNGGTQAMSPASVELIERRFARLGSRLPPLNGQGLRYLQVVGLLFVFNLTNNMVGPLVPQVLVNTLKLSDAYISIGSAASSMLVFMVSLVIARFVRRTGNRKGTSVGAILLSVQVVILALAHNTLLYFLSVLVGGIASGILSTTQMNYNLENVPSQERSIWLSWSLLLGNAALLSGALLGPAFANLIGLQPALILFGVFRLLAGLLILGVG